LVFNDKLELQPLYSKALQIEASSNGSWSLLECTTCAGANQEMETIREAGYVMIYVDNASIGKEVWFDNLNIKHSRKGILEENFYYPFGLTVSSSAMEMKEQPLKYQTKELEKSFGLEMYDFGARMYAPQLGKTWQPDPMAEKRLWTAPYSWVQNNPIKRIDPTGAVDDEFDKDGNKISDLGGDKIDFYHQGDGSTKILDRETGASNVVKGGEKVIRGYTHREKNTSWGTLYWEWEHGTGPSKSLFADFDDSQTGIFGSFDRVGSTYSRKARASVLSEGVSKNAVNFGYTEVNPVSAGTDGWEQFIGRANLSYYKLGNKVLFMMNDSKSMTSFAYRAWPLSNQERNEHSWGPYNANTYQTYIWTETMTEIQSKNAMIQDYIQRLRSAAEEYKSNPRYLPTLKD